VKTYIILAFRSLVCTTFVALGACAGGKAASAGPAVVEPAAERVSVSGLTVVRPGSAWTFVQPDASVAPHTLVILQGQAGDKLLAPVVEISRRTLSAADQRRRTADILTTTAAELMQTFDGFEGVSAPADVQVAGRTGSRMEARYTEMLPDGPSVERVARIYAVRSGADLWLVRCLGPADKSADADFDAVVSGLQLQGS